MSGPVQVRSVLERCSGQLTLLAGLGVTDDRCNPRHTSCSWCSAVSCQSISVLHMSARTICPRKATSRRDHMDRIRYYAYCACGIYCTIRLFQRHPHSYKYNTYCLTDSLGTNTGRLRKNSLLIRPLELRDGYFGTKAAAALH